MAKVIQSQRQWDDFNSSDKVGVITTMFSEQFIEHSYNIYKINPDNYEEEIELNGITTVFMDNDLFETDHKWYKKNRGHIINYLKNNNKNIVVIKNTTNEIAQIFKKAFVLEINSTLDKYLYSDNNIEIPILINSEKYNPINTKQSIDIVYFQIGGNKSVEDKKYNQKRQLKIENITSTNLTRTSFIKLIESLKNAKILYITHTTKLDYLTLEYIEKIASLLSVYVILDHRFEIDLVGNEIDFKTVNNKMSFLLRNSGHLFKEILAKQRNILLSNTFVTQSSLNDFLNNKDYSFELPKISVVTSTNRPDNLKKYLKHIGHQKLVELEINIITHGFTLNEDVKATYLKSTNHKISFIEGNESETLGTCLNKGIDKSSYPVIAKIDDDDFYMEYYLIDQWLCLQYSNADVVGKSQCFYYFEESNIIAQRNIGEYYQYSDFIMGATIMSKSEVIKKLMFADIPKAVDTNFLRRLIEDEGKIYIGHPYEMCVFRSSKINEHTWKVNDLAMLKNSRVIGYGSPENYIRL